jgi:hypothetical protein
MITSFLSFGFALLVFALSGEAQSQWLRIAGFLLAGLFTFSGAVSGWKYFQK